MRRGGGGGGRRGVSQGWAYSAAHWRHPEGRPVGQEALPRPRAREGEGRRGTGLRGAEAGKCAGGTIWRPTGRRAAGRVGGEQSWWPGMHGGAGCARLHAGVILACFEACRSCTLSVHEPSAPARLPPCLRCITLPACRLMGRAASHITLECALQTHPQARGSAALLGVEAQAALRAQLLLRAARHSTAWHGTAEQSMLSTRWAGRTCTLHG